MGGWLFAYLVGSAVGGPILFPVFLSKIDVLLRVTTTCLCQAIETEIKKFLAPSETGPQFFLFTDRLFNFFFCKYSMSGSRRQSVQQFAAGIFINA